MKSYSDHTSAPITAAISELDAKQTAEIAALTAELVKYKIALAILAVTQIVDLVGQFVRSLG